MKIFGNILNREKVEQFLYTLLENVKDMYTTWYSLGQLHNFFTKGDRLCNVYIRFFCFSLKYFRLEKKKQKNAMPGNAPKHDLNIIK